MATREIKTRFKLEGEQEYRRAMSDAASAIKVLNSEQKLAEAQYEATGDAQEFAAEKSRILKAKIEEQQKAVAAAETALKKLAENGVSKNSREMQTWQTKLINAKTQLAKMETQLQGTEKELKDQSSATAKAKTAMENAERKVKSLTEEEKLAEAQFKATGDKEAFLASKAQILKGKIEAQQEAVEAAEAAIKSMTDEGVDPASKEMLEWKSKLTQAKTQLAYMETQLQDTEKEIKDQSSATTKAKTAMDNAERKIKSLTAEEKLAEAQFKATGDKEQYAAEKTRILKEKIQAQKSAVEAAEKAIKALTDEGIDPASDEMQEWKSRLNQAKIGLMNLESRMDKVGDETAEEEVAFRSAGGTADELKESIDKVGQGVDFQNVISAIDGITGTMEKTVKMAARAAKAVWEMGVSAGQWADNIATAANEAGIDVETYQAWQYASRFIDTSVDDIVKSWQDIQKHMEEGNTDYFASLAKMGIATRTSAGKMRESSDIFWDAIDYLHGIDDGAKRAEKATELFGNDWRKLNPLITAGSKAYKDMADEGRTVAVVSEKNVQELGGLDDAVQDLGAKFDKLKYDALAELAPTLKEVATAMATVVTSLDEFVQSEEGRAAIQGLHEAVSGLLKSFLGEDNGQGTFEDIVKTAKGAVEGFTGALNWISENGNAVKDVLLGMAGVWAGLKVSKTVLQFCELLKATPLKNIQAFFSGGSGASAPTSTGSGPAGTAAKAVGANAKKKIAQLTAGGAGKDLLVGGGVAAAVVAAATLPAILADAADRQRITQELTEVKETAAQAAEAVGEEGQAALEMVNTAADAIGVSTEKVDLFGQGVIADAEAVEKAAETLRKLDELEGGKILSGKTALRLRYSSGATDAEQRDLVETAMMEALEYLANPQAAQSAQNTAEVFSDAMDSILEMQEALDESPGENIEGLYQLVDTLANNKEVLAGLSEETRQLLAAYFDPDSGFGAGSAGQFKDAQDVLAAMMGDLEKSYADAVTLGGNVSAGMASGIYQREGEALRAAEHLANGVTNTVQNALDIQSPSKVFARLGAFTAAGFAQGIEGRSAEVSRAVDRMLGAANRATAPLTRFGGAPVGRTKADRPENVHMTLVLDEEVLADVVVPIVNGRIGAQIQAVRR